jgi:hypothetical protein
MSERALRMFRARVENNDLAQTKISYRVVGGLRDDPGLPPLPPPEEVLTVEGDGTARLRSGNLIVGEARLKSVDVATVFERVGANLSALVPRSEARFVPDSVLGEITVEVAGEQQQFYFLIGPESEEEEERPELAAVGGPGEIRSRLRDVVDFVRPAGQEGVRSWP